MYRLETQYAICQMIIMSGIGTRSIKMGGEEFAELLEKLLTRFYDEDIGWVAEVETSYGTEYGPLTESLATILQQLQDMYEEVY